MDRGDSRKTTDLDGDTTSRVAKKTTSSSPSSPGSLMSVQVRRRSPVSGKTNPPRVQAPAPRRQRPPAVAEEDRPVDANPALRRREVESQAAQVAAPPTPSIDRSPAPEPAPPPAPAPAPAPSIDRSPPAETPQADAPAEPAKREDIVTYWSGLRGGRRYPATSDLNDDRVAAVWPNSILVRCRAGSRALEPEKIYSAKGGERHQATSFLGSKNLNLSPLMLQWLLSLAAEVVREGRPMSDEDMFPSLTGSIPYQAVALPFSQDQSFIDHVLCHFSPGTGGAAK